MSSKYDGDLVQRSNERAELLRSGVCSRAGSEAAQAAKEARRQTQLAAEADALDTALQQFMEEAVADMIASLDEYDVARAQSEQESEPRRTP